MYRELAARRCAAVPGEGGRGTLRTLWNGREYRRDKAQAGKGGYGGGRNKMARMDKFLAEPALIHRILGFDGGGTGRSMCRDLGSGQRRLRVNVGLDRQALEEKAQKGEHRQPLARGRETGDGVSEARHEPLAVKFSLNE